MNENNAILFSLFFNPLVFKETVRISSITNHRYTVCVSHIRPWSHANLVVRGRKHSSLPCIKKKIKERETETETEVRAG